MPASTSQPLHDRWRGLLGKVHEVERLASEYRRYDPGLSRELDVALDHLAGRLRHLTDADDPERDAPATRRRA